MLKDQIYCLRGHDNVEQWYCVVDGREFGFWYSKGAAQAGLQVEQRRAVARRQKTNPNNDSASSLA